MKNEVDHLALMMADVVSRLSTVQRYNTSPRVRTESVAEHTFCVAFFAYIFQMYLRVEMNIEVDLGRMMSMALIHDVDEAFTGDVVHTVKHHTVVPELREALDRVSVIALSEVFSDIPGLLRDEFMDLWEEAKAVSTMEAKIFKLADVASILYHSNLQELLGNRHFVPIRERAERRFEQLVNEFGFPPQLCSFPKAIRGMKTGNF